MTANIAPLTPRSSLPTAELGDFERGFSRSTVDPERLGLAELARALWRRKLLMVVTVVVVEVIAIAVILGLPPRFFGRVVLVVGAPEAMPGPKESVVYTLPDATAILTEVELIRSRVNVAKVVDKLKLTDSPEFNIARSGQSSKSGVRAAVTTVTQLLDEAWGTLRRMLLAIDEKHDAASAPESPDTAKNTAVDIVESKLRVSPKGNSRAILLEFESPDAAHAATIVNAVADEYIEQHRAFRAQRRAELANWLKEKVSEFREQVEKSENAVEQFRSEKELQSDDAGMSFLLKKMSDAESQIIAVQADRAGLEARLSQFKALSRMAGGIDATNDALRSPGLQALEQKLNELQRMRAQLGTDLQADHPKMIGVQAAINDVAAKIRVESAKITSSLENEIKISAAKEALLRQMEERLRLQIAQTNQADITLRALQREAHVNSMLLEAFLTRVKGGQNERAFGEDEAQIVSYATVPRLPEKPNRLLLVLLALGGSLVVAVVLAVAVDKSDLTFRSSEEIEPELGLRVLGYVPKTRSLRTPASFPAEPLSSSAEAIRSIYVALRSLGYARPPGTVMFTSAQPREGKTTLALSFSAMAARSGQRVLIIDADLRTGSASNALGLRDRPGLADLLIAGTNGPDIDSVTVADLGCGLCCLPAGRHSDAGLAVQVVERLPSIIECAKLRYDLIVVDSPPLLVVSDSLGLSAHVDATVLAIHWGTTPRKVVKVALDRLIASGAKVAGVALTMIDVHRHAQYGYGDSELYSKLITGYHRR